MAAIHQIIEVQSPKEWLLLLEVLELAEGEAFRAQLLQSLMRIADGYKYLKTLIEEGIEMLLESRWQVLYESVT
ncbi:MAG: hypothetical protein AAF849_14860 [Bacteroidota bacterium]